MTELKPINNLETRITSVCVLPKDQPLFAEMATRIEIVDEGAGEFVVVSQSGRIEDDIRIDPVEWPSLKQAVEFMLGQIRDLKQSQS